MKVRFIKEIREINQMLGMFRQTKTKCMSIMRQLRIDESQLQQYKKIEKLFSIDLNILGQDHLIQRKNKLMEAFDNIMKLQTTLTVKKARQLPEIDQQEDQSSSNSTKRGFKPFNSFSQLIKKEQPKVVEVKKKQSIKQIKTNARSIQDQKRFNEAIGKLMFNNTELTTIWYKNKPSVDQTADDKLDRLSRTIGALRKNGRTLYEEQRLKTSCINFLDYNQFTKILTQLDRIKMQNQQLRAQIYRLTQQNNFLKFNSSSTVKTASQDTMTKSYQTQTEAEEELYQEVMVENEKFKIIKYYKQVLELDSFIEQKKNIKHLQIQESCILKSLNNDISDSVIECMVDRPLERYDSYQYLSTSNRLNTYQEQPFGNLLTFSKRIKTQFNPENIVRGQPVLSPIIEAKDLNSVESKLKEIRQNRKKIINDDDLWSQVENMKM